MHNVLSSEIVEGCCNFGANESYSFFTEATAVVAVFVSQMKPAYEIDLTSSKIFLLSAIPKICPK